MGEIAMCKFFLWKKKKEERKDCSCNQLGETEATKWSESLRREEFCQSLNVVLKNTQ